MGITYTWKVTGLKTKNVTNTEGVTLADAVIQTQWEITGTDEHGHKGIFAGAAPLSAENVPEANFIPLSSLTEAQVLTWIQAIVTDHYWEHVQERIAKQIEEQEITTVSLPWATE